MDTILDSVPRHVRSDLECAPEWRGVCSGGMPLTRAVVDTSMGRVLLCVVHETFPRRLHGHQAVAGFFDAFRRPSSPGRRSIPVGSARVHPVAVARRYAGALADHVEMKPGEPGKTAEKDPSRLEAAASELALVVRILDADPKFGRFFADPSIPQKDKQAVIDALSRKARLSEATRDFLRVLVINRRLGALASIRRAFEEIKDERLGVVQAETTTAVPLSAAELKRLREALETVTGRRVNIRHQVDPALLGGARTRIGSRVYDGTLRHQLEALRRRLVGAH